MYSHVETGERIRVFPYLGLVHIFIFSFLFGAIVKGKSRRKEVLYPFLWRGNKQRKITFEHSAKGKIAAETGLYYRETKLKLFVIVKE